LKFFKQTLIEFFSSNLDEKFFIAISITIENLIRIDRIADLKF